MTPLRSRIQDCHLETIPSAQFYAMLVHHCPRKQVPFSKWADHRSDRWPCMISYSHQIKALLQNISPGYSAAEGTLAVTGFYTCISANIIFSVKIHSNTMWSSLAVECAAQATFTY